MISINPLDVEPARIDRIVKVVAENAISLTLWFFNLFGGGGEG